MKFKCLITLGLCVAVQSASIFSKPVDIPVKIIYGEDNYEVYQTTLVEHTGGRSNLDEKIQLSSAELKQLSKLAKDDYHGNPNSLMNLDEKIQLSREELLQAEKHLPLEGNKFENDFKSNSVEENSNKNDVENSNQNVGSEVTKPEGNEKPNENSKPVESGKPEEVFGILGEVPPEKETLVTQSTTIPSTTSEENLPDPNLVLLIQIAQNIVWSGLDSIRENIDSLLVNGESNKNPPISTTQWNRLNQTISDFFSSLLERGSLKSNTENILRDIAVGVESATNNFVQTVRDEISNSSQSADSQTSDVGQNVINLVASGVQRITENINNIPNQSTTKNTILGAGATTAPPGPIQNIINQFQQFFGQVPSNPSPVQGDTPSTATPPGPAQVIQSVASQVGQAINSLNPFTPKPTASPGTQGDVGSTPENPLQNVVNQVGQAINTFNPFKPANAAPGSQADTPTTNNPFQSLQNAANQVGQAINSLNPFNQPATAAPGSQGDAPTPNNPLQPFQNAANQIGQAIGSLNPFRPTIAPGAQSEGTTIANGPFQVVQNVVNQFGQAVNNLNPFNQGLTPASGSQNEDATTPSRPFQQAVQNVANQVGSVINSLNPFTPPSTPAAGLQSDGTTSHRPLEGVQNVINQAGQAVSSLNPLNQVPTLAPSNKPLEGVQNAINQVGHVASSLNPLNQGSSTVSSPISGSLQTIQAIGGQGQQLLGGQSAVKPVESVQTLFTSVNKPADQNGGAVETIQSISSQIINPERKSTQEEKLSDSISEQEIMIAVD